MSGPEGQLVLFNFPESLDVSRDEAGQVIPHQSRSNGFGLRADDTWVNAELFGIIMQFYPADQGTEVNRAVKSVNFRSRRFHHYNKCKKCWHIVHLSPIFCKTGSLHPPSPHSRSPFPLPMLLSLSEIPLLQSYNIAGGEVVFWREQ